MTATATTLTHCAYSVSIPTHRFACYVPLTRDGLAVLVNYGTTPTAERLTDPEFLARLDAAIESLRAGRNVKIGAAVIWGITTEEYERCR